mmetsp:Transcript_9745/g.18815  ORF Transcript_9745/g.18815 Transcript_9745/m.18815 type:complete len:505 (-) Transcript_9745:31-1545(-)
MVPYSPDPGVGRVLAEYEAYDLDDPFEQEEEFLNSRFVANSCRGLANGYARSECERSRALVVGCNYPRNHRNSRLWGACADARAWATTLTKRLGVPETNVALLVDEADDGKPANAGSRTFPSQRNIHDHLLWLTNDVQPGDLLVFVFCGRGTLLLDDVGLDPETGDDTGDGSDDDCEVVEEALLCGDFDNTDWMNGYSKRMVTATSLARYWEGLPNGASLTLVIDAENGASMLPVARRLDSARLPLGVNLNDEPTPMLEPMVFGSVRSRSTVAQALQMEASRPEAQDPRIGRRDSGGAWPKRRWLRGQLLWDALAGGDEAPAPLETEVQAFAFTASGPGGAAFEVDIGRGRRQNGPSARRGLLTHCLLHALEELNFQGTYYALWWCSLRLLRKLGVTGQHFQLLFADGADPTCREAFEVIGAAEARAYARRSELQQQALEDGQCTNRAWTSQRCCSSVIDERCHRKDEYDLSFVMDEGHGEKDSRLSVISADEQMAPARRTLVC